MSDDLHNFTLLGGYNNGGGGYASADFQSAEETQPASTYMESLGGHQDSVQGIVQQTLQRHISEGVPVNTSPRLTSFSQQHNNWRKRLREMMVKQNEEMIGFLFKPVTDHPHIGPAEKSLRRFAMREDIDVGSIKPLKQILSDISGGIPTEVQKEVEERLALKGPSSIIQLKQQVTALLDFYKETGEKVLECENQLKMRLEKMDKLQKQVSHIMELQTNDATQELIAAEENYLRLSFRGLSIEHHYKTLLHLYQKHYLLREAISLFKTGNQLTAEPSCPVCMNQAVDCAIVPCGHTYCFNCARRMMSECSICRGRIRDRMKIYFT
jgi:hypothetical protein